MSCEHAHATWHLNARPDKAEELGALLASLWEPTRQEPGCIRFELQQNRAREHTPKVRDQNLLAKQRSASRWWRPLRSIT